MDLGTDFGNRVTRARLPFGDSSFRTFRFGALPFDDSLLGNFRLGNFPLDDFPLEPNFRQPVIVGRSHGDRQFVARRRDRGGHV